MSSRGHGLYKIVSLSLWESGSRGPEKREIWCFHKLSETQTLSSSFLCHLLNVVLVLTDARAAGAPAISSKLQAIR